MYVFTQKSDIFNISKLFWLYSLHFNIKLKSICDKTDISLPLISPFQVSFFLKTSFKLTHKHQHNLQFLYLNILKNRENVKIPVKDPLKK